MPISGVRPDIHGKGAEGETAQRTGMSMSMRGDQEPDLEAGFSHEEEEVEEEEAPEFELHALLHSLVLEGGEEN